jgi:FkbM family methyltransferase
MMVRPSVPDPPELSAALWEGTRPGSYAWDVGANCGQTIMTLHSFFPQRVAAFEPSPDSFGYMESNNNIWGWADFHQLAVSDHDGEVELAYPAAEQEETGQLVTPGLSGMEWEPADWSLVERVTVPCRTADSLAAEHGTPDFMKVDTEGHELAVLRGAAGIVTAGVTDFLIEFHSPGNQEACCRELEGAGYGLQILRHPHYAYRSHMWLQHGWIRALAPRKE